MATTFLSRRGALRAITAGVAATIPIRSFGAADAKPAISNLRRGMNLWPWFSLTREFPPPRIDYDWPPYDETRAIPGRRDLESLRKSGIDFVRIPVDPGPFLAFSGERHADLMARVNGALELTLNAGLKAIINLHPNGATHHFTPRNMLRAINGPMFTQFLQLVRDMAAQVTRFDPARVAFEPLNEPPQDCASADWPAMQREIVRTARRSATRHTLVVSGACGSMIAGLEGLNPATVGDENVIYTFHFYEPYVFSHQGAPWMRAEPMYRYLTQVPWPSSAGSLTATLAAVSSRMAADQTTTAATKRDIAATIERVLKQYFDAKPDRHYLEGYFARVVSWAQRFAIPHDQILLGEFGALRTDRRYIAARPADRARYIEDVRRTAEALGIPWAFWNFFDGMGLTTDDQLRAFDRDVTAALGLTMPD
jgi:hypothetical protein